MATLTHLPHLTNMQSGINKWDPSHSAVYELYFTLPDAIRSEFSEDEVILTEQVTEVSGLDQLTKTTPVNSQKFMGVDVSHHGPAMENTYADITVTLNLNLRNKLDNFVLKVFRAWENLNYNLADGTRTLLADYSSDAMRIAVANRAGDVVRSIVFNRVLLSSVTGIDTLNYTDNEPQKVQVTLRCDYWDDALA